MNKRTVNREPHIACDILYCLLLQPKGGRRMNICKKFKNLCSIKIFNTKRLVNWKNRENSESILVVLQILIMKNECSFYISSNQKDVTRMRK